MRWLLPILSLVFTWSAFGELAVYTGVLNINGTAVPHLPAGLRVAEIVDLGSGKIVSVTLTGGRTDFTYDVGPEVQYVIGKLNDGRGHTLTAFAQAGSDVDANGSTYAVSSTFRGHDEKVSLTAAGSSRWPRVLVGTGSFVAGPGTDAAAVPASVSFSSSTLTLSEGWSKLANQSGTLTEAAVVIGAAYRDRVASYLHYPPVPTTGTVPGGSSATTVTITTGGSSSGGVITTGVGTQIFTGGTYTGGTFLGGTLQVTGGTLQLTSGSVATNVFLGNGGAIFSPTIPVTVGTTGTLTIGNTPVLTGTGATLTVVGNSGIFGSGGTLNLTGGSGGVLTLIPGGAGTVPPLTITSGGTLHP